MKQIAIASHAGLQSLNACCFPRQPLALLTLALSPPRATAAGPCSAASAEGPGFRPASPPGAWGAPPPLTQGCTSGCQSTSTGSISISRRLRAEPQMVLKPAINVIFAICCYHHLPHQFIYLILIYYHYCVNTKPKLMN